MKVLPALVRKRAIRAAKRRTPRTAAARRANANASTAAPSCTYLTPETTNIVTIYITQNRQLGAVSLQNRTTHNFDNPYNPVVANVVTDNAVIPQRQVTVVSPSLVFVDLKRPFSIV